MINANWPAPANIKALITDRTSWGNHPLEPTEKIKAEEKLQQVLNLNEPPYWLIQTHSNIVVPAFSSHARPEADASFTAEKNRACVVLTADCLPLLICNKQGSIVAAVHAGWRGLANDIIENVIANLSQPPESVLVWLGPAIGQQKYEVGVDVYEAFVNKHPASSKCFIETSKNKWLANLYQLATLKLNLLGITQIYGGNFCTYSQSNLFFSFRRDQGKTGRMASLIWIED